jgi:hypothetical protein
LTSFCVRAIEKAAPEKLSKAWSGAAVVGSVQIAAGSGRLVIPSQYKEKRRTAYQYKSSADAATSVLR